MASVQSIKLKDLGPLMEKPAGNGKAAEICALGQGRRIESGKRGIDETWAMVCKRVSVAPDTQQSAEFTRE